MDRHLWGGLERFDRDEKRFINTGTTAGSTSEPPSVIIYEDRDGSL
jgi:hypothetical protein